MPDIYLQEKAQTGFATRSIHPTLMQKTRTHSHNHTTTHTASIIHLLGIYTREIYIKQRWRHEHRLDTVRSSDFPFGA